MSAHQEEGGLHLFPPAPLHLNNPHAVPQVPPVFLDLFGQRIISDFFRVAHPGIHILTDQQAEQTKQITIKFVVQPFVSIQPFVFLAAVETSHP